MSDKPVPPPLSTLTEEEGDRGLGALPPHRACLEQGVPLAQVAKHHGLLRTVQRWVDATRLTA